ncbi:hypothetical protein EV421DRAFT_1914246 [Armillaria borealis]|uniref:Uncharacterized protein n=1 Tax=Armillaria borealis TaxID=47425 RepID=A0AA39ISI0_9AGAR|nr:hypothetical protein EV421DRAFT_1914246 [Armillaria borealis]
MAAPTYQIDTQRQQLLASSNYTASSTFSASHEWVADGSADILSTTAAANSTDPAATPQHAKISIVGRVLGGPRFLKLKDVGNYNDQYMSMSASKWVIHLGKPTGTIYEEDWALSLSNVCAFEEHVATSRGINMLVYTPNDAPKDLRATAPCFVPNEVKDDDKALVAYKSKIQPRFRGEYDDLSPWWKLNELRIVNAKGFRVPAGVPQEKSMEKSLVVLTFTITHNYISSSKVDSFSAIIDKVRVLIPGICYDDHVQANANTPPAVAPTNIPQAPPVLTVTTVTIGMGLSASTAASNVGNNTNNNTAGTSTDITSTDALNEGGPPGTETDVSEAGKAQNQNETEVTADGGLMKENSAGSTAAPKDTAAGTAETNSGPNLGENLQQGEQSIPGTENAKQVNEGKKPVKSTKRKADTAGETSTKKSRA